MYDDLKMILKSAAEIRWSESAVLRELRLSHNCEIVEAAEEAEYSLAMFRS
jgi:hypothetical protein